MVSELVARPGEAWHSFEYFPPKTKGGIANLKKRMQRMENLAPRHGLHLEGGRLHVRPYHGALHLRQERGRLRREPSPRLREHGGAEGGPGARGLHEARRVPRVARRGGPPRGQEKWEAVEGGFNYALGPCKYVREHHGDYFTIAFAG